MRARLTYNEFDGTAITIELCSDTPVTLGRSRDNNVILRDEHASRMHSRIHFDQGQWRIRDFGLNGTKVNGTKIEQEQILRHGDELRLGDTKMRFSQIDATAHAGSSTKRIPIPVDPPSTRLQHDDLTVLCNFMAAAVREPDMHGLLLRALDIVLHQTSANVVGFLSDDPNDPVTKLVLPDAGKVDVQLSKQLNRRVKREGKAVWLCSDMSETRPSESVAQYSDAICVPVVSGTTTLGTLHVYRTNTYFSERDVRFCEALIGYLATSLHALRTRRSLEAENSRLRGRAPAGEELVGDSAKLRDLRQIIERVAPTNSTVLIHGESGVGKELVALDLHRHSDRCDGPLVPVNCAAIPAALIEAQLFGYCRGAFSGADRDHPGYFSQAAEGVLFLDEVAELSLECQSKLLRAIETKRFRPVGGTNEIHADVRIVAATHRDLDAEVRAGKFRQDLYFRLKVVVLDVPPLREHAEDVPLLAQYFLDRFSTEHNKEYRLSERALAKLKQYPWPGNVRQLRTALENAAVMSGVEDLDIEHFRFDSPAPATASDLPLNLEQLERWAVVEALKQTNGNKTAAAKILGISRDTMHVKCEKYGSGRGD